MIDKLKPKGDRLLVRRAEPERSLGGIFIPDTAQERPDEAIVVRVSDECGLAASLKPGDRIVHKRYAGVVVDDEHLLIYGGDVEALYVPY